MSRPPLRVALGSAVLLGLLGSAGCNVLFGIEELGAGDSRSDGGGERDGNPGELVDGAPEPPDAGEVPDAGPPPPEYLGFPDELPEQTLIPQDTLWMIPVGRLEQDAMLESIGIIQRGDSDAAMYLGVYLDGGETNGLRWFEAQVPPMPVTLYDEGLNEIGSGAFLPKGQNYWIGILPVRDIYLGSGAATEVPTSYYLSQPFSMGMDTVIEETFDTFDGAALNVFLELSPLE